MDEMELTPTTGIRINGERQDVRDLVIRDHVRLERFENEVSVRLDRFDKNLDRLGANIRVLEDSDGSRRYGQKKAAEKDAAWKAWWRPLVAALIVLALSTIVQVAMRSR